MYIVVKNLRQARVARCVLLTLLLLALSWVAVQSEDVRDLGPAGRVQSQLKGIDVVQKTGANDSSTEQKNLTAAMLYAQTGQVELLKELLVANPDVAARQYKGVGITALHYAAQHNQVEAATLLIRHGADVSVVDNSSRHTPLHTAAGCDALDVVKVLIEAGADINCLAEGPLKTDTLSPTKYASPLDVAAEMGAEHVVEFLLTKGAKLDVNPQVSSCSALHRAMFGNYDRQGLGNPKRSTDPTTNAARGNRKVIEMLLAHKADLNGKDSLGNTPFHIGVYRHALDSVDYLLKNYADRIDVNAPGQFKMTPLQLVVSRRRQGVEQSVKGVITLLREHGASVTLVGGPSVPQKTAFEVAQREKWGNDILDLLRP